MEAIASLLSLFFGLGCFGVVPLLLSIAALVDAIRTGAGWYWVPIVLFFPILGAVAYFLVVRSPLGGRLGGLPPAASRRQQARRRLRALDAQLAHWRGPGILAEAGENLLTLGRWRQAEAHFREAVEAGADPEDVDLGLAEALQAQGRYSEAIPLLERQAETAPSFRQGDIWLQLGRCLDEQGDADGAVTALGEHLQRGSSLEAKVRLARLFLRAGRTDEAQQLLADVRSDAAGLPRYLRREHGRWIRAARRLRSGSEKLPRPRFVAAGGPSTLLWALAGAAIVVVLMLFGALWSMTTRLGGVGDELAALHAEGEALALEQERLGDRHPWRYADDLAAIELEEEDLDAYVRVRRRLAPALRATAEERLRIEAAVDEIAMGVQGPGLWGAFAAMEQGFEMTGGARAENELRRAVVAALAAEERGPGWLARLAELVEWRFLGREELLPLGLPDYYRPDYFVTLSSLEQARSGARNPDAEAGWRREMEGRIVRLEAKLADLEARAAEARDAISPATRELLAARRRELETLPRDGLRYLAQASDPDLPWPVERELAWRVD